MADSLDLLIKIKAENAAAGKLTEIKKDIDGIDTSIKQLKDDSQNINPKLEPEKAKEYENAIQSLTKEMDKLKKEARDIENVNLTNLRDGFNNVASAATQTGVVLGGIAAGGFLLGKSLVDAASEAQSLKTALYAAFQGDGAGADKLNEQLITLANNSPFVTKEIQSMGVYLKAFGIDAEKIPGVLTLAGDAASLMGKDLQTGVRAYVGALSGNFEMLKENFGVTRDLLESQLPQAIFNANGSIKDMEGLVTSLGLALEEKFGGGMEKASKTLEGQISTLQGEFETLKAELGEELLPVMQSLTDKTIDIVRYLKDLSPETKRAAVGFLGLTTGVTALGAVLAGTVAVVATVGASISTMILNVGGLSVVMGALGAVIGPLAVTFATLATGIVAATTTIAGLVLVVSGAALGISLLVNKTLDYKKALADLQIADITKETNEHAESLNKVKDFFGEVTNATVAYNQVKEQGIDRILQEEQGAEKLLALTKLLSQEQISLTNQKSEEVKALNELNEKYTLIRNGKKSATYEDTVALENEISQHKEIIAKIDNQIENKKKFKNEIYESTSELKNQKTVIEDIEKIDPLKMWEDIGNKFGEYTEKIEGLSESWTNFEKEQKLALAKGEINEKDYYDNIKKYLEENQKSLDWDKDKKIEIETKYYEGIRKLEEESQKNFDNTRKSALKEEETRLKERENIQKAQYEADLKAFKEAEKKKQEALQLSQELQYKLTFQEGPEGTAKADLQQKLDSLQEEIKAFEDAGLQKQEIEQYYTGERKRLINDYYQNLFELQTKEVSNYLKSRQESLSNVQALNDLAIAEGLITEEQAKRNELNYYEKEKESLKEQVDLIKEQVSLLGSDSLTDSQREYLNRYTEVSNQIKDINGSMAEQYGLIEDNANMTASQIEAQNALTESIKNSNAALEEQKVIQEKTGSGEITQGLGMEDLGSYFSDLPGSKAPKIIDPTGGGSYGRKSYSDLGNLGFDNPLHDSIAWKAGEKIVENSISDMISNLLSGMVSSVTKIVNQTNQSYSSQKVQDNSRNLQQNLNLTINGNSRPATAGINQNFNKGLNLVDQAYGVF